MQHILVPTDFSAHSERALEWAIEVGRRLGASSIRLLHSYYVVSPLPTPEQFVLPPTEWEHIREGCVRRLEEGVRRIEAAGLKGSFDLQQKPATRAILEDIEANQIDLVVMGTHGRTGIDHVLFGSIAERIVSHAPCPVLTVTAAE
jgi:nucleotide-binding universal stress UspA family protein